ncbi:MAG: hypothetical protein ACI83I_002852, partial [Bacteroidia bacterium]
TQKINISVIYYTTPSGSSLSLHLVLQDLTPLGSGPFKFKWPIGLKMKIIEDDLAMLIHGLPLNTED